jgi:hypothetical protein
MVSLPVRVAAPAVLRRTIQALEPTRRRRQPASCFPPDLGVYRSFPLPLCLIAVLPICQQSGN